MIGRNPQISSLAKRYHRAVIQTAALLILTLSYFGAAHSASHADTFTWQPQCPDPTWFGTCDGEICDVGNQTPLSLNNWGLSGCGSVPFPGAADDVVIPNDMVDLVSTTIQSLTIATDATVNYMGITEYSSEFWQNDGTIVWTDSTFPTTAADTPTPIANNGLIRTTGASALSNIDNTGEVRVESGALSLAGNQNFNGGTLNILAGAEVFFQSGTEITGDFVVDGAGSLKLRNVNTVVPLLRFPAPGATIDCRGPALIWERGNMFALSGATITNRAGSTIHNVIEGSLIVGNFVNEGLFIDEFALPDAARGGATFVNAGEHEIRQGVIDGGVYVNSGLLRKTTAGTAMLNGTLDLTQGAIQVEAGELWLEGSLDFGEGDADITVAENAILRLRGEELLNGRLEADNAGELFLFALPSLPGIGPDTPTGDRFQFRVTGNGLTLGNSNYVAPEGESWTLENLADGVVTGGGQILLRVAFENRGTFRHSSGLINFPLEEDSFENFGTYHAITPSPNTRPVITAINNYGLIRKTGPQFAIINNLNNANRVEVEEGTLFIDSSFTGTESGLIHVHDGASVRFDNTESPGTPSIRTSGVLNIHIEPGGDFAVENTSFFIEGTGLKVHATGEELNWRVPVRRLGFPPVTFENLPGSTIVWDGNVTALIGGARITLINRGTMRNTGRLVIEGGINPEDRFENHGVFEYSGENSLLAIRTINTGLFTSTVESSALGQGLMTNFGEFVIESGRWFGLIDFQGGRVEVKPGAVLDFTPFDVSAPPVEVLQGSLGGGGRIDGPLFVDGGVIAPGSPVGELTINGVLSTRPFFSPSALGGGFAIDLAGPPESGNYDRITINGGFTDGVPVGSSGLGRLRLAAVDGFVPEAGMTYEIITATDGIIDGTFGLGVTLVNFPPGLTIQQVPNNLSFSITIVEGEPSPFFVLDGDMNCDININENDIEGFVLALIDADAYELGFPICDINRADMNDDGLLDSRDIPAFIDAVFD